MNPRLDALLRQQELLREHAQWLEDEIAAERARTGAVAPVPAAPRIATVDSPPALATKNELPEPDIKGLHNEVRSGCLLYFVIAAGLLGALIGFIYWKY